MKIIQTYSYFNGLEFLLVRKQKIWREIKLMIESVDDPSIAGWSRSGIVKDRVAIGGAQFGEPCFNEGDYLKSLRVAYERHEIDVGVGILPMDILRQHIPSSRVRVQENIGRLVLNVWGLPVVPIAVVAISA